MQRGRSCVLVSGKNSVRDGNYSSFSLSIDQHLDCDAPETNPTVVSVEFFNIDDIKPKSLKLLFCHVLPEPLKQFDFLTKK